MSMRHTITEISTVRKWTETIHL